jgi:hypothetical protein
MLTVPKKPQEYLDLIASKKEVYGDGGEYLSYRLWDQNHVKLYERHYQLEKVQTIDIPSSEGI